MATQKKLIDDSSDQTADSKAAKKQKLNDYEDDNKSNMNKIAMKAWEHYRNYLDSMGGGEDEDEEAGDEDVGDVDELLELLEVLKPHVTPSLSTSTNNGDKKHDNQDDVSRIVHQYRSLPALLPVLCSIAHYHLADTAISETVDVEQDQQQLQQKENDALYHLHSSIQFFDYNAATWSMGSNYGRMKDKVSPSVVCQWYERAADCASTVRKAALQLLDGPNSIGTGKDEVEENEEENNMVKEWIELLFLDGIAGAEYVGQEGEEEDEEENVKNEEKEDNDDKEEEEAEGYFCGSRIEAIARFMASMLLSTAGKHDEAMKHLKRFRLTHRLHPNVWTGTTTATTTKNGSTDTNSENSHKFDALVEPVTFPSNALPSHLYQQLCTVFSPDAKYWKESNYAHRGYYSYFMDIPTPPQETKQTPKPLNLIETVVFEHLLPRAKQILSPEDAESIVGAEWWVHTRPIASNLGHNMHFDTDEALLAQEGLITHPILSSVLYLTGGEVDTTTTTSSTTSETKSTSPAGATIVLDQTPDSEKVADFCWRCVPRDNTLMLFPGNLLHGVLPCPGRNTATSTADDDNKDTKSSNIDPSSAFQWNSNNSSPNEESRCTSAMGSSSSSSSSSAPHAENRLTFMVGFWTRRVPDQMKHRKIYGPCGPMPPTATGEHTWVNEIQNVRKSSRSDEEEGKEANVPPIPVPRISPAWEELVSLEEEPQPQHMNDDNGDDDNPLLDLPHVAQRIDHRFFVNGAPQCFRESLFQDDDSIGGGCCGDEPAGCCGDEPASCCGDEPASCCGDEPASCCGDQPASNCGDQPASNCGGCCSK